MRAYELMVLIDPEVDERTVEPTLGKFLDVVRNDGGTIDNVDVWGRRRLAYDIKKKSEAIYVVVNFTATPATSAELDRQLSLNETILRTKIIRPEDQKVAAE
jgi:small subunit ribosomal protein S6